MKPDVIVIGGGVIGTACAYELSSRGVKVLVVDKGDIGFGCSYGNAGWMTPCFAMPLPMPGQFLKALGWLMDPESPLYIKPALDPLLFRWITRFLLSMRKDLMLQSVAALTEISKFSLEAYQQLAIQQPAIQFQKKGLLMATKTQAGLDAAAEEMELVSRHGISGRLLNSADVKNLEPALIAELLGGVYFPNEAHAEPLEVVRAFARGAELNGAELKANVDVKNIIVEGNQIKELSTSIGVLQADQYILATGSWSTELGKTLNLNIPVMGGKGYAMILPPIHPMPQIPLMLVEKKIAVTPRSGSLRIAGTLELVNQDFSITQKRVDAIMRGAREFLNLPEVPQVQEVWKGLRPCTPDGVPVIGRSKSIQNLVISTGHQMLGLQSAPGSARLASDIVIGATPSFNPHPFRVERF